MFTQMQAPLSLMVLSPGELCLGLHKYFFVLLPKRSLSRSCRKTVTVTMARGQQPVTPTRCFFNLAPIGHVNEKDAGTQAELRVCVSCSQQHLEGEGKGQSDRETLKSPHQPVVKKNPEQNAPAGAFCTLTGRIKPIATKKG